MHYLYLLKSKKENFTYIGSTDNLQRRLLEHNHGKNQATKFYAPFKIVYYEAYANKSDALSREYKLKHYGSASGHLKKRVAKSIED
ncbi:MAG: GIY-YIG nuclease family protein [Candidatus Omnitrophota bacterium]|nr:GIY-YIG nuclease family protein [Candidatus Omnitrophota bacterium]